jgi:hypothetical protein
VSLRCKKILFRITKRIKEHSDGVWEFYNMFFYIDWLMTRHITELTSYSMSEQALCISDLSSMTILNQKEIQRIYSTEWSKP